MERPKNYFHEKEPRAEAVIHNPATNCPGGPATNNGRDPATRPARFSGFGDRAVCVR